MKNLKKLTKKEKLAILEFEELLLEKYPKRIKKLILFGSKSRGDFHRFSDIDILVVIHRSNKHIRQEIAGLTHEPIASFGVDLSPIIIEERELKIYSPFINRVKKEGVTLWSENKKSL